MACKNCGKCCHYVLLMTDPDTAHWAQLHGMTVIPAVMPLVQIVAPCIGRDDTKRRCTIYQDRPDVCKKFLCVDAKGDA
jgi:Fe-S-cluster containining protein